MASLNEGEKSYESILLIVKSNVTNDRIIPLMGWLQLYILLYD